MVGKEVESQIQQQIGVERAKQKSKLTTLFAYALGLLFMLVILIPAVTLDGTADRNRVERGQYAWFIKQRQCEPIPGKDAKWWGGTSQWRCVDGSLHESRFTQEEILQFSKMSVEDLILYNSQRSEREHAGLFEPLIEFLRSNFRVNSNTLILLIILVQVTSINYRLRK